MAVRREDGGSDRALALYPRDEARATRGVVPYFATAEFPVLRDNAQKQLRENAQKELREIAQKTADRAKPQSVNEEMAKRTVAPTIAYG
jgi:hypothetical protein